MERRRSRGQAPDAQPERASDEHRGPGPVSLSNLDYDLPEELIAQHPAERRDASRLLVYDRRTGDVRHRVFSELPEELAGELVVVNDTRVVPARIRIDSPKGEVLLLERTSATE